MHSPDSIQRSCKRCGGYLPRTVRMSDTCEDCQSGQTLSWCDVQIIRFKTILNMMLASNAVLTNPEFISDIEGQDLMYKSLLALGFSEEMAKWAVQDSAGKPRYDDLEIEGARADLARLTSLRQRCLNPVSAEKTKRGGIDNASVDD